MDLSSLVVFFRCVRVCRTFGWAFGVSGCAQGVHCLCCSVSTVPDQRQHPQMRCFMGRFCENGKCGVEDREGGGVCTRGRPGSSGASMSMAMPKPITSLVLISCGGPGGGGATRGRMGSSNVTAPPQQLGSEPRDPVGVPGIGGGEGWGPREMVSWLFCSVCGSKGPWVRATRATPGLSPTSHPLLVPGAPFVRPRSGMEGATGQPPFGPMHCHVSVSVLLVHVLRCHTCLHGHSL